MEKIALTVLEKFQYSLDELTVTTFEPGEHMVSRECAEYAGLKGKGTYEGCPDPFEVGQIPLPEGGKTAKPKKPKKKG